MQNGNHALSTEEKEQFWRQGYLGPYKLCGPEKMLNMHSEIEKVLETAPPDHNHLEHNRHLDSVLIHNLATHPAIIKRMASLYGPIFCSGGRTFSSRNQARKRFRGIKTSTTGPLNHLLLFLHGLLSIPQR